MLWKLDLRLIPWLSLLYLAAFLDRTNVGNAKIEGLQQALNMTNNQYNLTLTIFFISYSVFEPLTNVLLKRTTPKYFITAIIVIWVSRIWFFISIFVMAPRACKLTILGISGNMHDNNGSCPQLLRPHGSALVSWTC